VTDFVSLRVESFRLYNARSVLWWSGRYRR
jgi:hypothetical protein